VNRLFRLSRSEVLLLLEVALVVATVRAALWICPYDQVRHSLKKRRAGSKDQASSATIGRFVSAVARYIPGANCLTRAVAAEALLRSHGHDARLRIGVSKNEADALLAHAWVESGGDIVIGGDAVA